MLKVSLDQHSRTAFPNKLSKFANTNSSHHKQNTKKTSCM